MLIDFFKFLFRYFNKKCKILFFCTAFIAIALNTVLVIMPIIQKRIIEGINLHHLNSVDVIKLLVIVIVASVISIISTVVFEILFTEFKEIIVKELLGSVTRSRNKIIETKGPGAFMVSIFGDSEQFAYLLKTNYFQAVILCISSVIILSISFSWSFIFGLVVIPSYILMLIVLFISSKLYVYLFAKAREMVFALNPRVLEYIENRDSIINYSNILDYEISLNADFCKRDVYFRKAAIVDSISKTMLSVISNLSMLIFFVLSIKAIVRNNMTIAQFFALFSYFSQIYLPINAIKEITLNLSRFKMLKEKTQSSLKKELKMLLPKNNKFVIDNVNYHFDNYASPSLREISLEINERLALVGLSGEGKTTLIKLLLGKISPSAGFCTIGETPIASIPHSIVNNLVRYYPQENEIFNSDISFNITLGKKGILKEKYDEYCSSIEKNILNLFEKITNIRRNKNCYSFFTDMEKEILQELFFLNKKELQRICFYDIFCQHGFMNMDYVAKLISSVIVSRRYFITQKYDDICKCLDLYKLENRQMGQRGVNISGGEKSKISLARFLLPENESFFIIDEPFTGLDLITEKKCLKVLKNYLIRYKGGVVISHKINVIKEVADKIHILENGKITHSGYKDKLLKENNLFKRLNDICLENTK